MLGANRELAGAEVELVDVERREQRLKLALAPVAEDYDFILIDCPPSLSMLTLNGLCSAHGVIVPMQCEYFALEGLTDLVNTIKQVHANMNKDLQIIGLLRVMFDPRITLQQQVSDQLKSHFGDKVFNTVIPRNVRLAEAPSYGLPGVVFDPAATGQPGLCRIRRRKWWSASRRCRGRLGAAPHPLSPAIDSIAMKPSNVLILPGWENSGPHHWQTLWEQRHGYVRVEQHDWNQALARRLAGAAGGHGARVRRAGGAGGAQPGLHPGRGLVGASHEHAPGEGRAAGRAGRRRAA